MGENDAVRTSLMKPKRQKSVSAFWAFGCLMKYGYDGWRSRVFELKRLFFLDLSMVDRRLHGDLRHGFGEPVFRSDSKDPFKGEKVTMRRDVMLRDLV
jgi:hypothetical protein